jgi:alkylation response protein AidB-like acyl-CoA dehydrogenase
VTDDRDPRLAARKLRALIESEAGEVEATSTMTPAVVDALVESGLFRLLVPREFDGLEAGPSTIIDVCEELSFADGSVGWPFAQNTTVLAYAAYLEPEHAVPLARARAAAGMLAPSVSPTRRTAATASPAAIPSAAAVATRSSWAARRW